MEKVNKLICMILLSFLLAACQSYKKVPYLQDVEAVNQLSRKLFMMQRSCRKIY